jgi:hypothetical protein
MPSSEFWRSLASTSVDNLARRGLRPAGDGVELVLCGCMTSVYPILLGTEEFREKPYSFVGRLPDNVQRATKERLLAILADIGVTPSAKCATRSVRQTVGLLLEYQGVRWDRVDFAEMEVRQANILGGAVPGPASATAQPAAAPMLSVPPHQPASSPSPSMDEARPRARELGCIGVAAAGAMRWPRVEHSLHPGCDLFRLSVLLAVPVARSVCYNFLCLF